MSFVLGTYYFLEAVYISCFLLAATAAQAAPTPLHFGVPE